MIKFLTNSPEETERAACRLAKSLLPGDTLAFRGGLGAGKTAFVRGLAEGLGIADGVSSPTFSLVHEYGEGGNRLVHFDMYRVIGPEALESTGYYDYLGSGAVLAIEWSENIISELPENAITVTMAMHGENIREITVEGGERF